MFNSTFVLDGIVLLSAENTTAIRGKKWIDRKAKQVKKRVSEKTQPNKRDVQQKFSNKIRSANKIPLQWCNVEES